MGQESSNLIQDWFLAENMLFKIIEHSITGRQVAVATYKSAHLQ